MNSSVAPRVRLVCRFVRVWSSYATEARGNRPTAGFSARHVSNCADCQRYFAAADQLDAQLRRGSVRMTHSVPSDLEARIFGAIEPTLSTARTRRHPSRPRLVWLAVAASSVAAAVVFVQLREPQIPAVDHLVNETALTKEPAAKTDPGSAREELPAPIWSSLIPRVATLTEENPLRREMDAVESDARSALRFLARNFLPTSVAPGTVPAGGSRSSS